MTLHESDIPDRKLIMRKGEFVLDPVQTHGVNPFVVTARLTTRDFFAMFDTPFLYGGGWDEKAQTRPRRWSWCCRRRQTRRRSADTTASDARCGSTVATSK